MESDRLDKGGRGTRSPELALTPGAFPVSPENSPSPQDSYGHSIDEPESFYAPRDPPSATSSTTTPHSARSRRDFSDPQTRSAGGAIGVGAQTSAPKSPPRATTGGSYSARAGLRSASQPTAAAPSSSAASVGVTARSVTMSTGVAPVVKNPGNLSVLDRARQFEQQASASSAAAAPTSSSSRPPVRRPVRKPTTSSSAAAAASNGAQADSTSSSAPTAIGSEDARPSNLQKRSPVSPVHVPARKSSATADTSKPETQSTPGSQQPLFGEVITVTNGGGVGHGIPTNYAKKSASEGNIRSPSVTTAGGAKSQTRLDKQLQKAHAAGAPKPAPPRLQRPRADSTEEPMLPTLGDENEGASAGLGQSSGQLLPALTFTQSSSRPPATKPPVKPRRYSASTEQLSSAAKRDIAPPPSSLPRPTTPQSSTAPRRYVRSPDSTPTSGRSVKAMIKELPDKSTPPPSLRSSRPRVPLSEASTASSRARQSERASTRQSRSRSPGSVQASPSGGRIPRKPAHLAGGARRSSKSRDRKPNYARTDTSESSQDLQASESAPADAPKKPHLLVNTAQRKGTADSTDTEIDESPIIGRTVYQPLGQRHDRTDEPESLLSAEPSRLSTIEASPDLTDSGGSGTRANASPAVEPAVSVEPPTEPASAVSPTDPHSFYEQVLRMRPSSLEDSGGTHEEQEYAGLFSSLGGGDEGTIRVALRGTPVLNGGEEEWSAPSASSAVMPAAPPMASESAIRDSGIGESDELDDMLVDPFHPLASESSAATELDSDHHQDSDQQNSDHVDSDHVDSDHQDSDHQDSDHQHSDYHDSDSHSTPGRAATASSRSSISIHDLPAPVALAPLPQFFFNTLPFPTLPAVPPPPPPPPPPPTPNSSIGTDSDFTVRRLSSLFSFTSDEDPNLDATCSSGHSSDYSNDEDGDDDDENNSGAAVPTITLNDEPLPYLDYSDCVDYGFFQPPSGHPDCLIAPPSDPGEEVARPDSPLLGDPTGPADSFSIGSLQFGPSAIRDPAADKNKTYRNDAHKLAQTSRPYDGTPESEEFQPGSASIIVGPAIPPKDLVCEDRDSSGTFLQPGDEQELAALRPGPRLSSIVVSPPILHESAEIVDPRKSEGNKISEVNEGKLTASNPRDYCPQMSRPQLKTILENGFQDPAADRQLFQSPRLPEIPNVGRGLGLSVGETDLSSTSISPTTPKLPVQPPPPIPSSSIAPFPPSSSSTAPNPPTGPGLFFKLSNRSEVTHTPQTQHLEPQPSRRRRSHSAGPSVDEKRNITDMGVSSGATTPVGGPSLSTEASATLKRLTKRRHVVTELVTTELDYRKDLAIVAKLYITTAATSNVSASDVRIIFGNWAEIQDLAEEFRKPLIEAASSVYYKKTSTGEVTPRDWEHMSIDEKETRDFKTRIGGTFQTFISKFGEVYGNYIRHQKASSERLETLQREQHVVEWLELVQEELEDISNAWNLDAFLVKPLQRLTKYPLLLKTLMECTPNTHPDYTDLELAYHQLDSEIQKINARKARFELVQQLKAGQLNSLELQKKKVFGLPSGLKFQRKKKPKKKTDMQLARELRIMAKAEDITYTEYSRRFGAHFFQIQIVIADISHYIVDVKNFATWHHNFASSLIELADCDIEGKSPESVSRWVKFDQIAKGFAQYGIDKHAQDIKQQILTPLNEVWNLHQGPQKLMAERKRHLAVLIQYLEAEEDKRDNPKLVIPPELVQGKERFEALNITLKEDLPKLYSLTDELVNRLSDRFMDLLIKWQKLWVDKMAPILDVNLGRPPKPGSVLSAFTINDILLSHRDDFEPVYANAQELAVCNGALRQNITNYLSPTPDDVSLATRPSTQTSRSDTTFASPNASRRHSGNLPSSPAGTPSGASSASYFPSPAEMYAATSGGRLRGNSRVQTPNIAAHGQSLTPGASSYSSRPPTANTRVDSSSTLLSPRGSNDSARQGMREYSDPKLSFTRSRPTSDDLTTAFYTNPARRPQISENDPGASARANAAEQARRNEERGRRDFALAFQQNLADHGGRLKRRSRMFSSAMPMEDGLAGIVDDDDDEDGVEVMFIAASLFEFGIDASRTEAGYPYLAYQPGEIFDVYGVKGELWLARNQDDKKATVGWIWERHFARILDA